ncbi:MAG: hypothetical protein QME51_01385 [Planctomycetota bacterium]|nr:hypothetical protein [Planctomycetota bacterium]
MRYKYLHLFIIIICLLLPLETFSITVQLKNGSYLSGEIVSFDEMGLEFKSWHNNGILYLKWHHLADSETIRLKNILAISFTIEGNNEIYASRIYLKNGQILEGVISEKDENTIKIKTINGLKNVVTGDILKTENFYTEPLKIYKPQELYLEKSKTLDSEKASDNFELAEYCRNYLKLYDKAKEHYAKAAQLSSSFRDKANERISAMTDEILFQKVAEIEKLIENKDKKSLEEAKNVLLDIKKMEKTKYRDKAITELEKKITEAENLLASRVQTDLNKKILAQYYSNLKASIKKICSQGLSYQSTISYVNNMVYKQVVEKLSKDNKLSEKEILSIIEDKSQEKLQHLPKREISYGEGSWLVNTGVSSQSSITPEEFARYEKRTKLVAEAREKAAQKGELITPDVWWDKTTDSQREIFIEALFIETYWQVIEKKEKPCSSCSGEGTIGKNLCKVCWGTMTEIIIVYK